MKCREEKIGLESFFHSATVIDGCSGRECTDYVIIVQDANKVILSVLS
jgi:regulator of extracellular matrix RemA (YlzA/DUF370 family)